MEWQLQQAKSRLSELLASADSQGPQVITVRGKRRAVLLSAEDYERISRRHTGDSLVQFLRNSPLYDADLDVARSKDEGREVEL